jgi:hypothetical protein
VLFLHNISSYAPQCCKDNNCPTYAAQILKKIENVLYGLIGAFFSKKMTKLQLKYIKCAFFSFYACSLVRFSLTAK